MMMLFGNLPQEPPWAESFEDGAEGGGGFLKKIFNSPGLVIGLQELKQRQSIGGLEFH
jgi:hypothetical protein